MVLHGVINNNKWTRNNKNIYPRPAFPNCFSMN